MQRDARIYVPDAFASVCHWVEKTGDPDLGLKAALQLKLGNAGMLDYAMRSARCLRDAFALITDYGWQFSDTLEVECAEEWGHSVVRVRSTPPSPRAVTDFTLGALYRNHIRPHLDDAQTVECYFRYRHPASICLHRLVFHDAQLHFGAHFDGFGLRPGTLDRTLTTGTHAVHALHCKQLEKRTIAAGRQMPIAAHVRWLVSELLQHGRPDASTIARKLHMSRRTMARRLASEGTTYSHQVEQVRREQALRLARMETVRIGDIATQIGFSHEQAFRRAFRAWTGTTPLKYRRSASECDVHPINE